jgi:ectoine hydroxylase-related dioxygenase (phytanoyl-CoA dioxygenase family)
MISTSLPSGPAYFETADCDLADLIALTSRTLTAPDAPSAVRIEKNVPLYDMTTLRAALEDDTERRALMAEWAQVLSQGSGALVLKSAYEDTTAIEAATEIYHDIIAQEKAADGTGADHFAAAGNNDRVWNALQKLCVASPAIFADYFSNPVIDAVCEAWLGPGYQMTAQINLVRPGGQAQHAHRDYHLGFQPPDVLARYPAQAHDLSPFLTLQGGIAHCDMPIESGPTKLLPFSQLYRPGYAAVTRDDFRAHFEEACIQLPLDKGDAIFFSPALFHAAGENRSADIQRMANLLQVSSAFGRATEAVDRERMCTLLYPHVLKHPRATSAELKALLSATAEGYSFPTNLDNDPPIGGLAPETQLALFHRALEAGWSPDAFTQALQAQTARRRA